MGWRDTFGGLLGNMGGLLAAGGEALLVKGDEDEDGKGESSSAGGPKPPPEGDAADPKALAYDPFLLLEQLGYKDRPSSITYDTLQSMAYRVSVYTAILQTRIAQVRNFSQVQHDKRQPGFRLRLRDEEAKPSSSDRRVMGEFEEWFVNCGSTTHLGKDQFETFMIKLVRDALIYDQSCFEIVPNRKGVPVDFYAVDGATIRRADVKQPIESEDEVAYVQLYQGSVVADFTFKELCFGVRNPRTDIRVQGYGMSELEMGIHLITSLLHSMSYNAKFFTQGSVPKGVLNFPGIPDSKLRGFQRAWHQVVSGTLNAWRTPILNAQEVQYVDLHQSNRDMEWSAYNDLLIKLFSAICLINPSEYNFDYGNAGQSSQMFQAPAMQRIKEGKDRGLRPLLKAIAGWLNRYVLWQMDGLDKYELIFTGIDPMEGEKAVALAKQEVTSYKTVDEVRAEHDLEPIPDGKGACILDAQWTQFASQQDMAAQQEGGEGGPYEQEPDQAEGDEDDWQGLLSQWGGQGDEDEEQEQGGPPQGGGQQPQPPGQQQESMAYSETARRRGRIFEIDI